MKLLVVEDDVALRETLGLALTLSGHEVRAAAQRGGVLEELKKDWPDVLLLDYHLGQDRGDWIYQHILKVFGHTPRTIFLTGISDETVQGLNHRLPECSALSKPFCLKDLLAAITSPEPSSWKGAA